MRFFGWSKIFVVCFALLVGGCNYTNLKTRTETIPPVSNYKPSELSFASVYLRVFSKNCIACHDGGSDLNLKSFSQAKEKLQKIYQLSIVERKMPKAPGTPLTADQLGLLNAWIATGAQESGGPDDPPPPPPLLPTFDSLKANIFEPKCMLCHAPGKPVAKIPLVTRKDFLENDAYEIVIPGNSELSDIILAVTGRIPNKLMPPPKDHDGQPTGFSKLTDEEIKAIRDWIDNGAED